MISDRDRDALRRALLWGERFRKREPQIKVLPAVMPAEGTAAWLALGERLAAQAQAYSLGLPPWRCPPVVVADDAVADPDCYGRKPDEIALRQTLRALNISVFEPDVPGAIASAEDQRAELPRRDPTRAASHKRRASARK